MAVSPASPVSEETWSVWPARRSGGGDAALWVALAAGASAAASAGVAVGQEPGATMLLAFTAAAVLACVSLALLVWGLAYRALVYVLDPDALEVRWLGTVTRVPFAAVEGVYPGQRLVGASAPRLPAWPGIYVGGGRLRGVGRLRFFATSRDPAALTLVTTRSGGVVLSAREPLVFRAALIEAVRRHEGQAPGGERPRTDPAPDDRLSVVRDPAVLAAAGTALVALLLAVAVVSLAYGRLPERLPLRLDAAAQPLLVGPRGDLMRLPLGGLVALLGNLALAAGLHPREPVLARLLVGAAGVVQLLLLVALARLVQV